MSQKWNLQDIRPSNDGRRLRPKAESNPKRAERSKADTAESSDRIQITNAERSKRFKMLALVVVFVLVVSGIFLTSSLLRGAEIITYPRNKETSVQANFVAQSSPTDSQLTYELLTLDTTGERQVKATGQEDVTEQSVGEITITKNTKGAQPLIKNTRFESPEGLIFKLFESVVVPGAVEDEAGELSAGTVRARVFAESVGQEYNIAPTTFTVPGLKDDSILFNAIKGTSNEAFSGGFSGKRFIINDDELETNKQALQAELRNTLLDQLPSSVPANFVLYSSAVTFTFESLPAVGYGDDLATIKEKAYVRVPIFKEDDLATFIAENTIAGFEGEEVRLEDPLSLTFTYTNSTTSLSDISEASTLEFNVRGNTRIIWEYDEEQLKADLLNVTKNGLPTVLSGYPAIERAEATIRPFWKQSFPTNLTEIEVTEIVE